jgi:hypothetical protein
VGAGQAPVTEIQAKEIGVMPVRKGKVLSEAARRGTGATRPSTPPPVEYRAPRDSCPTGYLGIAEAGRSEGENDIYFRT